MPYEFNRQDVFDLAHSIGAETKQKGEELFFRLCPRCMGGRNPDTFTFSVNLDNGTFNCFRASCGYHGHLVELARDVGYPLDFGEEKVFRSLPQKPIVTRNEAVEYMKGRGISEEVCKQYGLTVQESNPHILVFPFYDENGVLTFVKYRNMDYAGRGNKEWCESNTKPILFGMKQCEDFDTLIITEGQIDSLSVVQAGFKNAVSVPTGAMGFTWIKNCWDWLIRFQNVICFGDFEKGHMTLLDTLIARLPQTIRAVRQEDYLGEKDANDILRKYGEQAVRTAIENAEIPRMSNVKGLETVQTVDINQLPKIKTNITEVDRVIGGLVYGQVILLTGKRGNGKSTFMSQLVAEALDQGKSVFVYSGELADYHFKRWLDFQLAGTEYVTVSTNEYGDETYSLSDETVGKLNKWYAGRAFIYDNNCVQDDAVELESVATTIEKVIQRYGCTLICVDNLMTAMDTVKDQDNLYLGQSNFVGKLKKIAVKYNVNIVLVAHPRKSNTEFTNDDVSGSSDITNKVDVVMSYSRTDEADADCDGKLLITKNRLFGKYAMGDSAIKLNYSEKTKRIFAGSNSNRQYGWIENKSFAPGEFSDAEEIGYDDLPF